MIAVPNVLSTPTPGHHFPINLGRRFKNLSLTLFKGPTVIGGLLTVFGGCATVPGETVENVVGQRAVEWAETLIELDYDLALTYMTPSYQASPRADRYRGDFSGASFWRSVTLHSVDCGESPAPSRCEVTMIISMIRPPELTREMPIPYDMTWVLLDGEWYLYRK